MRKFISLIILSLVLSNPSNGQSGKPEITEYQMKAAFLFNFARFVDWPEPVFSDTSQPICIGIMGWDPFGEDLDSIIKGKKLKGKNLIVKRFKTIDEFEGCHILYISTSENKRLSRIIELANLATILTVGESEDFVSKGGIIKLFNKNNKVRFDINLEAAEKSGLKISSRLLKLAENLSGAQTNGQN